MRKPYDRFNRHIQILLKMSSNQKYKEFLNLILQIYEKFTANIIHWGEILKQRFSTRQDDCSFSTQPFVGGPSQYRKSSKRKRMKIEKKRSQKVFM